jgi:hypothetical protein
LTHHGESTADHVLVHETVHEVHENVWKQGWANFAADSFVMSRSSAV